MAPDHAPIRLRSGEPMRCPSCGTRLMELERSEVLIDACPECRGVWLDRGELDEDEDFFEEMEGRRGREAPGRGRDPERDERKGGRRRRRGGILEDLLDFDF